MNYPSKLSHNELSKNFEWSPYSCPTKNVLLHKAFPIMKLFVVITWKMEVNVFGRSQLLANCLKSFAPLLFLLTAY